MDKSLASFLIVVIYLCLMLGVTIVNSKKKKSTDTQSFFLANRGVGGLLMALTMIAGMQSTFAFLGGPGMYYTHGISYIVIVLSQVWVAFMVIYFGNKIRKQAKKYGYMSIGDYFQDRFKSGYLKILASSISVLMTLIFLSMQYVGNATALSIITGDLLNYKVALLISVVFSLLYVMIGGAGGVVLLDAFQAVILMAGIVVAAIIAIKPFGGVVELFQATRNSAPELLSRPGPQGTYTNAYWLMQFIVLPFGIWLCPYIWSKSLMAKDTNSLAKSAISVPVSQVLIFGFSALFIGLAGHNMLGNLDRADQVLPIMMIENTSWIVAALVMAAAMSAGLSTINAMLLSCAQLVSQDLIFFNKKEKISNRTNMRVSRIIIVLIAIIASIIAIRPPKALVQVVQDVAYTGLAQLAPAFILGLYWKYASKEGASLGMTMGVIVLFVFRLLNISPLNIPGFLWAFVINILINVLVSLILKKRINVSEVEEKFF
ncbi:MAG: sodium:solute symporter family protein [Peptoniphilaceae bacterium]|nr:sodium:solute symporter family protein [Peptoniphilaceae bacterium]MDY6018180.1 sodium:solute symporter family protein [Anaerococcus sp.]